MNGSHGIGERSQQLVAPLDELQGGATSRARSQTGQPGEELYQSLDFRSCHATGQDDLRFGLDAGNRQIPGTAGAVNDLERQLESRRQRQLAGDRLHALGN